MSNVITKNDEKRKKQLRSAQAKYRAKARLFNAFVALFVDKQVKGDISKDDIELFLEYSSKEDLELFGIDIEI